MKPTASALEYALIGLLKQKPQSGYDLRKTFATTAMRHYSDSPGSIYPALRRLEARGLIAAQPKPPHQPDDPRRRQDYCLTEAGKAALIAWLEEPLTHDDVIWRIPELMLRFAFMDGNVPRSATLRFLEQFERELAIHAGESRAQFERMSADLSAGFESFGSRTKLHTGLLAFQSGIEAMETQLAWARNTRAQLAEEST